MSALPFPGPKPLPVLGNLPAVTRDILGFMTSSSRTWGDRLAWYAAGEGIVQLTDPADIETVLLTHKSKTKKDPGTASLDFILGRGLLTAEGDTWKRNRKIAAPFFTPKHLQSYADAMITSAHEDLPEAGQLDAHDWMSRVTLHIVLRTLFGMEPGGLADDVAPLVGDLMELFDTEYHGPARLLPEWVPLPHRVRLAHTAQSLDQVLRDLIAQRRAAPEGDDLLSRLLAARTEDGDGLTDTEVRDEAITMFLAGHETTSLALSYTLWLLAEHPEIQDRVLAELEERLGDRTVELGDVRALPYLNAVLDESMRLYPPAWTIGREALEDLELEGGGVIPKGSHVLMPQWVVHRDGRWFPGPLRFRPERWLSGETADLPRFAYFPFGGGPRVCIGTHFAKMEAILVLATVLRKYRFHAVPGFQPDLLPSVTLRPLHGIELILEERQAAVAAA